VGAAWVGDRPERRGRARDTIVTIGTVLGLVAAMALTLFGLGAADHAVASYDASSWLWSTPKGEVARVNGVTGKVDTRYRVPDTVGHSMQVTQTDRYLVLRDQATGLVSAIDLASLQVAATTPTTAGVGVSIALAGDAVFVIDAVQGLVRQLDPLTLSPVGQPVRFPPGIGGGTFDGSGLLWIAVPTEGTMVALRPAPTARASGGAGGSAPTPREERTVAVAEPNHELVVSALDDGVAVLDRTTATLTTLRGGKQRSRVLDLAGPGAMPARTSGPDVPVTLVDERHVYIVNGDTVHDFTVPGTGPRLGPCAAWSGRLYCPDDATGTVYSLSLSGQLLGTIAVPGANGPLELDVRERRLFINAPNSSRARVVDEQHHVKVVDKYTNQIVGGDPPPPVPPAQTQPSVGKPDAPRTVAAAAGNTTARVTWGPANPNGAAITRYVVEGDGKSYTVGANQRALDITGLTNGTTYRFSVHAVNAKGAGPKRTSNPVVPTSEVPDPPTAVTAKENADGTVAITWPAANGQGHKIVRYTVTATSAGVSEQLGEATTTAMTVPAGKLTYGTQYAFSIVSVNDKGAASKPSPLSNTVVPYAKPSAVKNLTAATVNAPGTIRATWQPADANGRPVTKYVVTAAGRSQDVTATAVQLNGFGPGVSVTVTVKAVNAAGDGPEDTATARTIAPPTVTMTGQTPGVNSMVLAFSVADGGSPATCTVSVNSSPAVGIGCGGGTVTGLYPNRPYTYVVTVTNAAGSATAGGGLQTLPLGGAVICNDQAQCGLSSPGGGIWVYSAPTQNPPPGRAVGDTTSPSRYEATCWAPDNDGLFIDARPWGGKRDNRWVRIKFSGDNYIPFAWFRLDGGDNLAQLPQC